MSREMRRRRMDVLTERALASYARVREQRQRRDREPPRPGDIFVLDETMDLPVEWLVLEEDPGNPERLVVVAVDLNPMVGSRDVAVPGEALSGPLSIRCGFSVQLGAERFDPARRTGFIEPAWLDAARRKRAEVTAGTVAGSILEQATDSEPEYVDWVGVVLETALATLGAAARRRESASRSSGGGVRARRPPVWASLSHPYRLAASILVAAALGFLAGAAWQNRLQAPEPRINLPLVLLEGTLRGQVPSITLPRHARHFLILFVVNTRYPSYRLEILKNGTAIWTSGSLSRVDEMELNVLLPSRWFSAGEYRLRLYGVDDGRTDQVEEYTLQIQFE